MVESMFPGRFDTRKGLPYSSLLLQDLECKIIKCEFYLVIVATRIVEIIPYGHMGVEIRKEERKVV